MEEIVHDRDDGAGRDRREHDVVIDAHPVVTMRRAVQVVVAIFVYDIARRAVRSGQACAATPCIRAISCRTVVVPGMKARVPMHLDVAVYMPIDVSVMAMAFVPLVTIVCVSLVPIVIAIPAPIFVARIAVVIACFGQNRTGHQGHCKRGGKDASHRFLP